MSPRNRVRLRGELRAAVVVNMAIVAFSSATGGMNADLLQLFAHDVLGFTPAQIGLALSLMLVSIPVQLRAPAIVRALGYRRSMRCGYVSSLVAVAALAALPALPDTWVRFTAFTAVVIAIEIIISCSWGAAWHAWMRQITMSSERPHFIAAMRTASQSFYLGVTTVFALVVGAAVSAAEYQVLLVVVSLPLVLSLFLLGRIPSPAVAPPADKGGVLAALRTGLASPGTRPLFLIIGIELVLLVPVIPLYLTTVLDMSASTVATLLVVRGLVGIAATVPWASAIHRRGAPQVARACVVLMAGASVLLALAGLSTLDSMATTAVVALAIMLSALGSAGYGSAMIGLWYESVPEGSSVELFTLQDVLNSSRVQLGFLLAGGALGLLGDARWGVADVSLPGFAFYLLLAVPCAVAIRRQVTALHAHSAATTSEVDA
jgi:hypothetical protein